jgi:7-cyano-7-deazaguanine synthase
MNGFEHETVILLSGGIDSTVALAIATERRSVNAVHVDLGQAAAPAERAAAKAISDHYSVPLSIIQLAGGPPLGAGEIVGRNALLCYLALLRHPTAAVIVLAIHAGTTYWDCSPSFVTHLQEMLDGETTGRTRVVAPFLHHEKAAIAALARSLAVPLDLTWSCESSAEAPCGRCASCRDREGLL